MTKVETGIKSEGKNVEIKATVDKETIENLEKALETLKELKPKLPEISKEKIEEIIDLITEAREKILPKARIEEIAELVGEREVEIRIKFDKLTIDGETTVSFFAFEKERINLSFIFDDEVAYEGLRNIESGKRWIHKDKSGKEFDQYEQR